MIRRPLQLARPFVDPAGGAFGGQGRREQDMVDAQAKVATERGHAVIPPGVDALLLFEETEGIGQAQANQFLESGPFWGLTSTCPTQAAGSCTSRSSGAML